MGSKLSLLAIFTFLMSGCRDDVQIQHQPFETQPVIYCVINPVDTVHTIRIERVFSGIQPPGVSALEPDSLYFQKVNARVIFFRRGSDLADTVEAYRVCPEIKEAGYFSDQEYQLYQFSKVLRVNGLNLFARAQLIVEVPGLPIATAVCNVINSPKIWSPNPKGQFIYIVHDRPLLIQWSGGSWNEVDIRFEIREQYADSVSKKSIHFQKVNEVHINGQYYEIKIPYELIVQGIERNFEYRKDIVRRYFGPVTIAIHTGQEEYARYIEYLGGINDFNQNPFSNIVNGLGLLTSCSTVHLGPMDLDQFSRFEFAADPILKNLSFMEY